MNLTETRRKKSTKGVTPGVYRSVVTKVCEPEGYVSGKAIEVRYELADSAGKLFTYKEIFFNSDFNERTAAFLDYLVENGVATLSAFEGCCEQLEIMYDICNNHRRPTIVNRVFISESDD